MSSFRKKSKKRAFLKASDLGLYIDDLRYGSASLEEEPVFGEALSVVHFDGRTRTPYSAGSYFSLPIPVCMCWSVWKIPLIGSGWSH